MSKSTAKDLRELYLIGYLQELHFNKYNREKYQLIDSLSSWSLDFKLIKKAFPDDADLKIFLFWTDISQSPPVRPIALHEYYLLPFV